MPPRIGELCSTVIEHRLSGCAGVVDAGKVVVETEVNFTDGRRNLQAELEFTHISDREIPRRTCMRRSRNRERSRLHPVFKLLHPQAARAVLSPTARTARESVPRLGFLEPMRIECQNRTLPLPLP